MADTKKNPLLGAFRAPPAEDKPPAGPTATPPKPAEEKKPTEPPKATEDKKPDDKGKETKDSKTPAAPAKAGEEKKPTEPPKAPEGQKPGDQGKEAKGDKAPASPAKAGDEKKPAEPPKAPEGEKPGDKGKEAKGDKAPASPAKAGEEKKPTEPPKAPEEKKSDDDLTTGQKAAKTRRENHDKMLASLFRSHPKKSFEGMTLAEFEKKVGKTINEILDPNEPPAAPKGQKPSDKGKEIKGDKAPAAPDQPAEEKKAAEQSKAPEGEKPGDKGGEIPDDFHEDIVSSEKMETETMIPVDLIDSFEDHPYSVKDNKEMDELVDSIKKSGLLEAVTVIRNPKKMGRFEMVSGHRRLHAAKLAGLTHVRAVVRVMDRDAAIIAMVDSNLKRNDISPMEKARAYQMKSDAMRRKAGRRSKAEVAAIEATGKKPLTVDQELAQKSGESVATVQRYKALNKLTEPLQEMVDKGKIPVNTAADIAQMKPKEQEALADAMAKEDKVPSGTKAKELKEASKAGTLTKEKIEAAVAPTKREVEPPLKVTLMEEDLLPYFPKGTTVPDVKKGIFEGLEVRKKLMERQKAKAKEEKEAKKKPPSPAR